MSLDRIQGVLYGQAIGDSLGYLTEFLTPATINKKWSDPTWPSGHPKHPPTHDWEPGDWTDDTDQAVEILVAYLDSRAQGLVDISQEELAYNLHHWMVTNGRGIGITTQRVMSTPGYIQSPEKIAHQDWLSSGSTTAPNGAVMRTSYVSIIHPNDVEWVERNAVSCAKVTHADPRCLASVVAVSNCIAYLIQGYSIADAMSQAAKDASKYDSEVVEWMYGTWDFIDPSNQPHMGYTYRCAGSAFWALRQVESGASFLDAIRPLIRAGADADTNAAVAGALVGAAIGASQIPRDLIDGLVHKGTLDQLLSDVTTPNYLVVE